MTLFGRAVGTAIPIGVDKKGFLISWLVFFVPGLLISLLTEITHQPLPGLPIFNWGLLPLLFFVVLLGPAVETLLLIAPTVIARKVIPSDWPASVVGALPISLMHISDGGLLKVLIVVWAFIWSGYCYLRLRGQAHSFRVRYGFLFGMHALSNGFVVAVVTLVR